MDFQEQKQLVLDHYSAMDTAPAEGIAAAAAQRMAPDALWRGMHPFHEQTGPHAMAEVFWQPLRHALRPMQRRMDVFMAGRNQMDDGASVWVVSMGHLMGLWQADWLGLAPTGKMAMLRYAEFNRVTDGQITETAMFCDIPHLMMQAGLQPFPPQTGAHLVQPGPMGHGGLLTAPQDPGEGTRTLALINAMIADLGTWQSGLPLEEELARTWAPDMIWWGPAGIGSSYTIPGYARQHAGPFRAAFTDRTSTGHICRLAEGAFGGFFGWPNFTARHTGGFMGMPASDTPAGMRVIDIYRRSGNKLAENWVFIDLLHFWNQLGVDILARMRTTPRT